MLPLHHSPIIGLGRRNRTFAIWSQTIHDTISPHRELFGCGGRIRTYDLQLMRLAGTADSPTPRYYLSFVWYLREKSSLLFRLVGTMHCHYTTEMFILCSATTPIIRNRLITWPCFICCAIGNENLIFI